MLLENNPYPQDVRPRLEAESLAANGYDVTIVAPRGPGQSRREAINGVTVRRFWLPDTSASITGIATEYLLANVQLYLYGIGALLRGADVVHLHNPPDTLFGVAHVARALGRRVVYDLHDIAPELFEVKFGSGRMVHFLRWLERRSARSADLVVTVNESLRSFASNRDGVPTDRVAVVRNAPPRAMFTDAEPGRGGELNDPRLVFVGSIESQDGVDLLPELVRILRFDRGLEGVTLTIVGDGGARADVEQRCEAAGISDRVEFTGRVPHAAIAGLLARADICVEPAPCNELNHRCSMVKVYEYMAAARPIVGHPLREVEGLAGPAMLYADCGDQDGLAAQIERLARDPELRRATGQRLRKRAEEMTWESSEQALLDAYSSLTDSTGMRARS